MSGTVLKISAEAPRSPIPKFANEPVNLSIKSVYLISAIPAIQNIITDK